MSFAMQYLPVYLIKSLCSELSNPLDVFNFTQAGLILFALNEKLTQICLPLVSTQICLQHILTYNRTTSCDMLSMEGSPNPSTEGHLMSY